MTYQQKREVVQTIAKKLGHCCCSKLFACECDWFKNKVQCHCAGEDGGVADFNIAEWEEYNTRRKRAAEGTDEARKMGGDVY